MKLKKWYSGILVILLVFTNINSVFAKSISKVEIYSGYLSAYDKEPTDATIAYRLEVGDIQEGYDVYIAVSDCKRIGNTGILLHNGKNHRYQIFDCSGDKETTEWMEKSNVVGEVDAYFWEKFGLGYARMYNEQDIYRSGNK